MVCNMYKGGKWCRYVEECVLIEIKKEFVLAAFFIYQVALVYVWIFIFT